MPKKSTKKASVRFTVDCSKAVADKVLEPGSLGEYLTKRIKVNGKTGTVGEGSSITVEHDTNTVTVQAPATFSKRYVKYLTKKFLKKQELREFLRVVASNKNTYELRYYDFGDNQAEE